MLTFSKLSIYEIKMQSQLLFDLFVDEATKLTWIYNVRKIIYRPILELIGCMNERELFQSSVHYIRQIYENTIYHSHIHITAIIPTTHTHIHIHTNTHTSHTPTHNSITKIHIFSACRLISWSIDIIWIVSFKLTHHHSTLTQIQDKTFCRG